MDILEAVVAFSLLMIVFSTIVSAIVELINRILHRRESGFLGMIESLYDELRLRILPSDGPVSDAERRAFCQTIITNKGIRVFPQTTYTIDCFWLKLPRPWRCLLWLYRQFSSWFTPRHAAKLDVVEFVRRVAETDIGREIARRGDTAADELIDEISIRFEEYVTQARDFFRQSAYAMSILVSVSFAFLANVDAVKLFDALRHDAALRIDVITQADKITSAMEAQQKALEDAYQQGVNLSKEEWDKWDKQIRDQLSPLEGKLPIGFNYFPGCNSNDDPRCNGLKPVDGDDGSFWTNVFFAPFTTIKWFLSVLTTGLLIGLGGPFWFDVYANLSRVLGLAKAVRNTFGGKELEEAEASEASTKEISTKPKDAFKTASRVIRPTRPRPILGSNGEPI